MVYDGLWWLMMVYDGLWWLMMVNDGLWWLAIGDQGFPYAMGGTPLSLDGLQGRISFKWIMTGGTPISRNLHVDMILPIYCVLNMMDGKKIGCFHNGYHWCIINFHHGYNQCLNITVVCFTDINVIHHWYDTFSKWFHFFTEYCLFWIWPHDHLAWYDHPVGSSKGFHSHGGYPPKAWFMSGKIPWKWMMTGGTPISGNLHIYIYSPYVYYCC